MIYFFRKSLCFLIIFITLFGKTYSQKKYAIVLGDSNGAFDSGWVYQLSKIHPEINFINFSIPGNTIGFDNLGKDTLNTLKNIYKYLDKAYQITDRIDIILIMLGTNDCKAIFESVQNKVLVNLDSLLKILINYKYSHKKPTIVLITPPPAGNDSILLPKYHGISDRLQKLVPKYRAIAKKNKIYYIDIYNPLKKDFYKLTTDGIHFKTVGYIEMANIIDNSLKKYKLVK